MQKLIFPSKEEIVSHLQNHRLTNAKYNTEKKIIDAVADFFADTEKAVEGVDLGVMVTLGDLNEKLKLPVKALMFLNLGFTTAMIECGKKGKIIQVEDY